MFGPLDLAHIGALLERRRNDGVTHWEDCWKEHVDCALSRLAHEYEEVFEHYSAALDEIYLLRAQLEYEALVINAHLQLKTFPRGRRAVAEDQVERMKGAAVGKAHKVSRDLGRDHMTYRRILGDRTLTRVEWETRRED